MPADSFCGANPWDRDGDGIINALDSDDDGDGIATNIEGASQSGETSVRATTTTCRRTLTTTPTVTAMDELERGDGDGDVAPTTSTVERARQVTRT